MGFAHLCYSDWSLMLIKLLHMSLSSDELGPTHLSYSGRQFCNTLPEQKISLKMPQYELLPNFPFLSFWFKAGGFHISMSSEGNSIGLDAQGSGLSFLTRCSSPFEAAPHQPCNKVLCGPRTSAKISMAKPVSSADFGIGDFESWQDDLVLECMRHVQGDKTRLFQPKSASFMQRKVTSLFLNTP